MQQLFSNTSTHRQQLSQHIDQWRVLIVDDINDNKFVAETILTFSGATVTTADNGLHALDVLPNFNANIILLDLSMPEMDGWELLEALKVQEQYHDMVIIALTANAMDRDKSRALAAGFDGYITKPYDARTLTHKIEKIIQNMGSGIL
ncbi:MAG: response regulator [Anaerolineae bacterium]